MTIALLAPAETDDSTELELSAFIDANPPVSFMLYAGAGSGKTRSLTDLVQAWLSRSARQMELRGQTIAVITYTNAAADEVAARLPSDALVEVSTIHAFAWRVISPFQSDIRNWVRHYATRRIDELQSKSSRAGSKAEADRVRKLSRYQQRIEEIDSVRRFVYSPRGDNRTRDSLNHFEVLAMASEFLTTKPVLQNIVSSRHPAILVDESQDTNASMMDALITLEATEGGPLVGLFGDTMQRIYGDGKPDLDAAVPAGWARPSKRMNHRSRARIVGLANDIRGAVDGQVQLAREDKDGGVARLFVTDGDDDRQQTESQVRRRMAEITKDQRWAEPLVKDSSTGPSVKHLILEHHMASQRFGFGTLFDPLYALDRHREGLLDGSFRGLKELRERIMPLVAAVRLNDRYAVARIVRRASPLLSDDALGAPDEGGATSAVATARAAVATLQELVASDPSPLLRDVVRAVTESGLIEMPEAVTDALGAVSADETDEVSAWRQSLTAKFDEAERWSAYARDLSPFATQQGVKGLEFPHVLAVLSDRDARGFLFSYEQLFGVKTPSGSTNGDSAVDRTRRLFYVACTRAIESVAVLIYSSDAKAAVATAVDRGWFESTECEIID